jgi:3-oxoacyl-[acyl-carrier-protein] synthase III
VKAKQIGIVITNCSLFNPTPSLSAQIMNHFEMGSGTLNYNLGGMGCSAGVVALDLARQMLQLYPDRYALVVSHENLTSNWWVQGRGSWDDNRFGMLATLSCMLWGSGHVCCMLWILCASHEPCFYVTMILHSTYPKQILLACVIGKMVNVRKQ